jgi:hypothetical protein
VPYLYADDIPILSKIKYIAFTLDEIFDIINEGMTL